MSETQLKESNMLDSRNDRNYSSIRCEDGIGNVEVNKDALTEAIFRWRRGERKEALHYLENAFTGREFDGLGELTPEQVR